MSDLHKKNLQVEEFKEIHLQNLRKKSRVSIVQREPVLPKFDWICELCACVNFARRVDCFQCVAPRGPNSEIVDPTKKRKHPEPSESLEHQVEGVAKPIDSSNVGNRLLKKMGWTEGKGLGKDEKGMAIPIQAELRSQSVGLGMEPGVNEYQTNRVSLGFSRGEYAVTVGDADITKQAKRLRARFDREQPSIE